MNANTLRTLEAKAAVAQLVESHDVDVVMVQESKFVKSTKFSMAGFQEAGRSDRRQGRQSSLDISGGGTYSMVADTLTVETNTIKGPGEADKNTDAHGFTVYIEGNEPIRFVNMYVPPCGRENIDDRTQDFDPEAWLPHGERLIIACDTNGHHAEWDSLKAEDDVGRRLYGWLEAHQMSTQNDPDTPTRVSGTTLSSPDQTICGKGWDGELQWTVLDERFSDHFPIVFKIPLKKPRNKVQGPKRFNLKKARWEDFTRESETAFEKLLEG